jgi:hypothetical protein
MNKEKKILKTSECPSLSGLSICLTRSDAMMIGIYIFA